MKRHPCHECLADFTNRYIALVAALKLKDPKRVRVELLAMSKELDKKFMTILTEEPPADVAD